MLSELLRTTLRLDLEIATPKKVLRFAEMLSTRLSRARPTNTPYGETADRAVTHGDPVMVDAEDPEVAELVVGATVRDLGAVAVDHVSVEVERDVVGADHDAVVRAVD